MIPPKPRNFQNSQTSRWSLPGFCRRSELIFGQVSGILYIFRLLVSVRPPLNLSSPPHRSEVRRNRENPWILAPPSQSLVLLGKSKNVLSTNRVYLRAPMELWGPLQHKLLRKICRKPFRPLGRDVGVPGHDFQICYFFV